MDKLPSFRGIEAFVTAARTLNFRAAAAALNISASAFSHRITALEKEIGIKLFERNGKDIALTPAGSNYIAAITPGLEVMERATATVRPRQRVQSLSIATDRNVHASWLCTRLGRFLEMYPEASFELMTYPPLQQKAPDVVISPHIGDGPEGGELLFNFEVLPICHPDVVAQYGLKKPEDIVRCRLIEPPQVDLQAWAHWLVKAGVPIRKIKRWLRVESIDVMYSSVTSGLGVGIATRFCSQDWIDQGIVHPFDLAHTYPGGMFLSTPGGGARPLVQAFREWLLAEVALTNAKVARSTHRGRKASKAVRSGIRRHRRA